MSFSYDTNNRICFLDSDENAMLDISDFNCLYDESPSQEFIEFMGKSTKRRHPLNTCEDQRPITSDIDDDSGFCGSNLTTNINKMVKIDEEMILLKTLMKVNEPVVNKTNTIKTQNNTYSSKSKNGKYELKILSQPEEQHRARYLTEGSRGAIKDRSGLSHPIVKLCGYSKSSVKMECFIGHDKQLGSPHLFYQSSKITGKNSTRCSTKRIDGTAVIVMDVCPENDMQVMVDCVGILKERNVDVEQKLIRLKARGENDSTLAISTKKRSTRCRLVFRTRIPETNEILQVISSPILCTQPLGTPEICKKSVSQCDSKGGKELFIIGKNFLKDAKVIFKSNNWTKVVEPDKEFLHPTHMICVIPCYDGSELNTKTSIDVSLIVKSGGKYSDAQKFTFIDCPKVNTMTLINGTTEITSASNQLLVSNIEKPIIFTMIGSTSVANTIAQNSLSSMASIHTNTMNSGSMCYTKDSSRPETILSFFNEDTQMGSNLYDGSSLQCSNDSQMTQTFTFNNKLTQLSENTSNDTNFNQRVFKTESLDSSVALSQPISQYLTLNSFNTISSNPLVVNSSQMTDKSTIPSIASMNCDNILESIPNPSMTTTAMSGISSEPNPSLGTSVDIKHNTTEESFAMKSIIAQNPMLTSTASTAPVTQANNISALSEMSDAELLCFINPATFDQI